MTGQVSWEQLIFIVAMLISFGGVLTGVTVWIVNKQHTQHIQNLTAFGELKAATEQGNSDVRHLLRGEFAQKFVILDESIKTNYKELTQRVHELETYNAGLTVVLKNVESFRVQITKQIEDLAIERREDMMNIRYKLDSLIEQEN